jgi:hypothetical protein
MEQRPRIRSTPGGTCWLVSRREKNKDVKTRSLKTEGCGTRAVPMATGLPPAIVRVLEDLPACFRCGFHFLNKR